MRVQRGQDHQKLVDIISVIEARDSRKVIHFGATGDGKDTTKTRYARVSR